MAVCLCFIGNASAQWVVSDPGNLAQGIINTTKQIVQTSTTAKNTLDGFMEAQKIFQQGKVYYDALKAVHDVVKGGIKVKKSIELVAEISEIYVRNYQNMLADPNYTPDELTAISAGYAKLLSESADILQDLKNVVNVTGMSLSDAERLAIIDQSYKRLLEYRNLVQYYTDKNISVSYLRAKKKKDALNTFENVTKTILTDEITSNSRAKLEQLKEGHQEVESRLHYTETVIKEKRIFITDTYECYLGKEFLNPEKLDALKHILDNSTAVNLSEVIAEYRERGGK